MIDPYRAPRIQRLVPWRRPSEFTAVGMFLLEASARRDLLARASEMAMSALERVHRLVIDPYLAEEALAAGAMPAEFSARELRADGPMVFYSPENKHSGGFPTNDARMRT